VSVEPVRTTTGLVELGTVRPLICRVLTRTLTAQALAEHTAAVTTLADARSAAPPATIGDLRALLVSDRYQEGYFTFVSRLNVPVAGLVPFVGNLGDCWSGRDAELRLVLVLDQFEELFTRFYDPGPIGAPALPDAPDWRLRPQFFTEIEHLYHASSTESKRSSPYPDLGLDVRIVVSLRDDYVGYLEPLRRIAAEVSDGFHRLDFLSAREARKAIGEPARLLDVEYEEACIKAMLDGLLREGSFIEPTHLQIVCGKLWKLRTGPRITVDDLERRDVGGVEGILAAFFKDFLLSVESPQDRSEVLDILDQLITGSRTRNLVSTDTLVQAPYRPQDRRRKLLKQLTLRKLLREEHRGGTVYVEITHEFLIKPILDHLGRDSEWTFLRLRQALEEMHLRASGTRASEEQARPLAREHCEIVHESRDLLDLDAWCVDLMFRSVIEHGLPPPVVGEWVRRWTEAAPDLSWMAMPTEPHEATVEDHRRRRRRRLGSMSLMELIGLTPRAVAPALDAEERTALVKRLVTVVPAGQADLVARTVREVIR
jgi:hypothetical protein